MTNSAKTLEVISCPQTVSDLWDDLQKDIDPSKIIMKLLPEISYRFRFIGPFVTVRRLFVPNIVSKNVKKEKVLAIMNGKEEIIDESMKKIFAVVKPNSKEAREADNFFRRKMTGNFGQVCLMVNALVKPHPEVAGTFDLKVIPINRQICTEIASKGQNVKINGLKARDIVIRKQYPQRQYPQYPPNSYANPPSVRPAPFSPFPSGPNNPLGIAISSYMDQSSPNFPTHTVEIMEESFIPQEQIDYLMRRGLFDIRTVIKDVNEMNYGNYIYKEVSNYRMPKEFNDVIFDELAKPEENKHIEKAEEELSEVPRDAFENIDRLRGPINSLEVE